MPSRRLPETDDQRFDALKACAHKALVTPGAQWLITPAQNATLQSLLGPWRSARATAAAALARQTEATSTCRTCLTRTARIVSHFVQVLNFAIERGALPASMRAHYQLPVDHATVPDINTVPEALRWALDIGAGELARTTAGGPPMAWPTAEAVAAEAALLQSASSTQSTAKTLYDQMQEAIALQRPAVDHHIRDLWDTIEYNLRAEPKASSLRRKAREWGVFYRGSEPPEQPDPAPAAPAPLTPPP